MIHNPAGADNLCDTSIKLGLLSGEEFDKAVVPERMTRP